MAYDDILGEGKDNQEETQESLIKSLKYNVENKEKIIQNLLDQITELERQLETSTTIGI